MSCIILCSHLFGKVSQRRATLTTTEASRLLRRASYLRYNEPGGSCWLYVVNEKGIQHHAILKAALYTIVPPTPVFAFCTPKYCRLQKCG